MQKRTKEPMTIEQAKDAFYSLLSHKHGYLPSEAFSLLENCQDGVQLSAHNSEFLDLGVPKNTTIATIMKAFLDVGMRKVMADYFAEHFQEPNCGGGQIAGDPESTS